MGDVQERNVFGKSDVVALPGTGICRRGGGPVGVSWLELVVDDVGSDFGYFDASRVHHVGDGLDSHEKCSARCR